MSGKPAFSVARLDETGLPLVAGLEAQIFPDAWSLESLQETFRLKTSVFLGAWRETNPPEDTEAKPGETEEEPELVGYVIFTRMPPEGEILRIAAAADRRRMGVAEGLLRALWQLCEKEGITRVLLEVRSGNTPAINLYQKAGFKEDGVRKAYYRDPTEDALLMSRQL